MDAAKVAQCQTAKRIVAAFDFDGTITRSDSLRDFIRYAVGDLKFVKGVVLACPWLVGTLPPGRVSRGSAKAKFLSVTVGGWSKIALVQAAESYARLRLDTLVRPEMKGRLREHRRRGHLVVIVSASPSLYLDLWARRNGINAVIATELEFVGNRCSGALSGKNCWGEEKARRLALWLVQNDAQLRYAYGDSSGDLEMLLLASVPWMRGTCELPSLE